MDNQEKIDLINTLHNKVVDYDADGEICYYVNVPIDDDTRSVLKKLGKSDRWIDSEADDNEDKEPIFDLVKVGFEFADWWYEDIGFSLTRPAD